MAKFSGGKLNKDGILSYVYEAKPGGRKNNINIKNIGGEWFFVNKDGSKRTNLANKGKLSKTHITNLKGAPGSSEENIFASADVSPETGERSTSVDAGGGIDTNAQDTLSGPIQRNTLVESNVSLPQTQGVRPAPQISSNPAAAASNEVSVAPTRTNAGSSFDSMANPGSRTWEGAGQMNLPNQSSNTGVVPAQTVSSPSFKADPNSMMGPVWGAPVDAQPSGNLATQGISEWGDKGFASEQAMSNSYSSASPSGWSGMADAGAPTVETQSIGFGGRQEFVGDNTSNIAQDSTTLGGTDKKDGSSWGSAAGWDAAGNIMQGVGGLASAWTGIQNYKLARDAYNTQKNQWQADYNQRLKAYEDNKQLANQEIEARNRTLQARGQEANQYSKLA